MFGNHFIGKTVKIKFWNKNFLQQNLVCRVSFIAIYLKRSRIGELRVKKLFLRDFLFGNFLLVFSMRKVPAWPIGIMHRLESMKPGFDSPPGTLNSQRGSPVTVPAVIVWANLSDAEIEWTQVIPKPTLVVRGKITFFSLRKTPISCLISRKCIWNVLYQQNFW